MKPTEFYLSRPAGRKSLFAAGMLAAALAFGSAGSPAFAQGGQYQVTDGTLTWGISAYLNSSNFGRPNPLPEAYAVPAAFDPLTQLSTWGAASGTISQDGTAVLSFAGSSVNYASTSGGWLRLADLRIEIDGNGNGVVTAEVSYGSTRGTFDPPPEPQQGPTRIVIVDLAGNAVAPLVEGRAVSWTGLRGTWSSAFTDFLAVGPWDYATTVTNGTEERSPSPIDIAVQL